MKKYIFIIISSFIIFLLMIIIYSQKQYIKNYDSLVFSFEKLTYENKILPLVNQLSGFDESFDYRNQDNFGLNKINNKKLLELLDNSGLSYISNNNDSEEYIINYVNNIDYNTTFCVYIYSKNKFSKINELGEKVIYPELFNQYGIKFSKNRLIKINDDYGKYCSYPYFN